MESYIFNLVNSTEAVWFVLCTRKLGFNILFTAICIHVCWIRQMQGRCKREKKKKSKNNLSLCFFSSFSNR